MPGRFVDGLDARRTFVPDPLPPELPLNPPLVNKLSEVSNLLGRLEGTARTLPDPQILIRSFVRREAQLSSYIENTYARYEEVAEAEAAPESPVPEQVRETLNAERSILQGLEAVRQGRPVNNTLLRQLHSTLLDQVRGQESRGRYRTLQVYIGKRDLGIEHARFVPPPPHLLDELMEQFQAFCLNPGDMQPLLALGLQHYQFEAIHPFEDGNGRLGRTLILLGLCGQGLLSFPVVNPSIYFERNRSRYYDALLRVSTHRDWLGWLTFFLEGLSVAARESEEKLRELLDLQRRYHEAIRTARNSALLLTIIDHLFILPLVTIPSVAKLVGVTYPAAKNSVTKLVDMNILEPLEGTSPARFVARTILNALNAQPSR
ncbi:MAG: Fic family protein [Phycisphaerae bacterium]